MAIHETAMIDPAAQIHADARIDAYAIVDGAVTIAAGARLYPHSYVAGWTEIGPGCQIHPGAVVGHEPQDLHYDGARSYCRVGAGTIVREGATVHRGTGPESSTVVGQRCLLMVNAHVAHNCEVGDDVVLVNDVNLAGHVRVGSRVVCGGAANIHQFVRIGELAMVAGLARATHDVPPFMLTDLLGRIVGPNVIGLRRAGFDAAQREEIKQAYRLMYRAGLGRAEALERLAGQVLSEAGRRFLEFVSTPSKRGLAPGARGGGQPRYE